MSDAKHLYSSDDCPIACPQCGANPIQVRAKDYYIDGDLVESYCDTCGVDLLVYASVTIEFTDVEVTDD